MRLPIQAQMPAVAIADAFLAACRAELRALKPGNVHIHAGGHDMNVAHFEAAAVAAAPHLAEKGARVGQRIRGAVEASYRATGCNTNLGIVLLCAPLAHAAGEAVAGGSLEARLASVLQDLDRTDAENAFAAIVHANPAGLGQAGQGDATDGDVHASPSLSLREAMALAADRDRIALAYVTGFADIFEFALPILTRARTLAGSPDLAVTTLHMYLLAQFPDTHIVRKFGAATAEAVRKEARRHVGRFATVAGQEDIAELMEFDAALKTRRLNPGTTADFVVATVFSEALRVQVADPSGI